MSTDWPRRLLFASLLVLAIAPGLIFADASAPASYQVVKTIKLGGEGRWDYATIDGKGELLYFPRSDHTIVVSTATGAIVADIPGGKGLHGVGLAPETGRGFITDGRGASVIIFDLKSHDVLGTIAAADDADGIIYDPASSHLFVACGDSQSLIPIASDVDPKTGNADPAIDLGGKPEFLAADGQGKVFVNLQDKDEVAVIDTKGMKVIAKYPTGPGKSPTGLSIDAEKGRLYIGCRNQKMIVMNSKDGSILADLPIGKGVDATAFNAGTALASCSDGTLTVIRETSPLKFEVIQVVKTAAGARTMAVDQQTGTIYLPTADMAATTNPSGGAGRPRPVPGTFKLIVVAEPAKS